MTDQLDISELKTFADWCRVKDHLPAEAKRTVEALLWLLECHLWAYRENANEALWLEWKEWKSKRESLDQCNCELADRILSTCYYLETPDWGGYSFQLTDLCPLATLTRLIRLDLNGNRKGEGNGKLCDLTPLTALTDLLELNLRGNAIADLSPLAELTSLIELNLSSNQITDITPLAALTELTTLDLSKNSIRDLSPLAEITTLEELDISYNQIADVSPLATLPNLMYLHVGNNDITDFSGSEDWHDLANPRLTIRQPTDLERLATLTNLKKLELVIDNSVKDEPWLNLTSLSWLTRLTRLELQGYVISDLAPLQTLTDLTYLEIKSKCLTDLNPLKFLINLTELRIGAWKTSIADLSPLTSLTKLTKLYLASELVSDLSPLASLTELTELHLASELVSDLSPLAFLTKLIRVELTGESQIADLSPLQGLTELTYLRCDRAKIIDINPLASLKNLKYLDLSNNQVTDISPLRSLVNLRELYINGNLITNTTPLLTLPKLKNSFVRNQRITVISPANDPAIPHTPLLKLQQQYRKVLTQPINRAKATTAVTAMYMAMGKAAPKIYFSDSPLAGVQRHDRKRKQQIPDNALGKPIVAQLVQSVIPMGSTAWKAVWGMMQFQPGEDIRASLGNKIWQDAFMESSEWFLEPKRMVACGSNFDAIKPRAYLTPEDLVEVISVSQMYAEQEASLMQASHYAAKEAMQQLLATCGWIIPYERACIVCDRPRHVHLDEENQLHAISEPAIEFADGWHSGYYHNGQPLPPEAVAIIKGWRLLEETDYNTALSYCQECITAFPKQSGFFTIRGVALMQLRSLELAKEAFDQAIQVYQDDPLAWYHRACLQVKQGQLEEAIADLQHALELSPDLADAVMDDEDFDPIRDRIQFLNWQKL